MNPNPTVDIQAAILLLTLLAALFAFVGHNTIKTSPRKIYLKLLGYEFVHSGQSFTLQELISKDEDMILPLYYRWLPYLQPTLIFLPILSLLTVGVCAYYLIQNLDANIIPRAAFVNALILCFCSIFVQCVMVLYIEKLKINIEG